MRRSRAKLSNKRAATRKGGNLRSEERLRLVREGVRAALNQDADLNSEKSWQLIHERVSAALGEDADLFSKKSVDLLGKVLVRLGGRWVALGEDDNYLSQQSLRLALEGDERVIRQRQSKGMPQSQLEKDFLDGKIPRKQKPEKQATFFRHLMALQISEYCKRLGWSTVRTNDLIRDTCGVVSRKKVRQAVMRKDVTWYDREVTTRGVSRQKINEWRHEVRAKLGKDATRWVDYAIREHGPSEKGLHFMIKYMEYLHQSRTAEFELDNVAVTKALVEMVRVHPKFSIEVDDATAAEIAAALIRTRDAKRK
jgi:hypothetical protein